MALRDQRIGQALSLVSAGGAALLAPPAAPVALGIGAGSAILLQFVQHKNGLRLAKYVLVAITAIIIALLLVLALGWYALWRLLT